MKSKQTEEWLSITWKQGNLESILFIFFLWAMSVLAPIIRPAWFACFSNLLNFLFSFCHTTTKPSLEVRNILCLNFPSYFTASLMWCWCVHSSGTLYVAGIPGFLLSILKLMILTMWSMNQASSNMLWRDTTWSWRWLDLKKQLLLQWNS